MREHILQPCWKGSALTSNHEGTHPTTLLERLSTYIYPCGNTSCNHARKDLHLHLAMWEHILQPCYKGFTLTSSHVGTHPATMLEGLSTPGWGFLVTDQVPQFSQRMASTLISDQVGTHPSITSEWPCTYIWSCGNTSLNHIRMALSPILSIPSNWPGASIQYYIWSCRNQSYSHIRMAQHSHMTWKETILSPW